MNLKKLNLTPLRGVLDRLERTQGMSKHHRVVSSTNGGRFYLTATHLKEAHIPTQRRVTRRALRKKLQAGLRAALVFKSRICCVWRSGARSTYNLWLIKRGQAPIELGVGCKVFCGDSLAEIIRWATGRVAHATLTPKGYIVTVEKHRHKGGRK